MGAMLHSARVSGGLLLRFVRVCWGDRSLVGGLGLFQAVVVIVGCV